MSSWLSPALPIVLALLVIPLVYFVRRSGAQYSSRSVMSHIGNSVSYQVDPKPQHWAYTLYRDGAVVDSQSRVDLRSFDINSGVVRIVHDKPSTVTTFSLGANEMLYLHKPHTGVRRGHDRHVRARGEIFVALKDGTLGWKINERNPDLSHNIFTGQNASGETMCLVAGAGVTMQRR